MCLLDKSLYGLRQAPRAWFESFASFAITIGFIAMHSDSSLVTLHRGNDIIYLLLYMDDIVLTSSSPPLLQQIVDRHQAKFAMKDMGELRFFLSIDVRRTPSGLFLS